MRKQETRVLKFKYLQPVDFLIMLGDPTYNPTYNPYLHFPYATPQTTAKKAPTRTLLPPQIESISPDNLRQELTVTGDSKALAELTELHRLLDIKHKELTLTLTVDSAQATAQTQNNTPTLLSVLVRGKLYTVEVTPHVNGDGSISSNIVLSTQEDLTVINWGTAKAGSGVAPDGSLATTFRRVKSGEAITFKWGAAAVSLTASLLPV
jgi:ribosomal protein S8E